MALRDLFTWRTYDPSEYSDLEIVQKNAKINAISLFCNNAGLALIAAGVARWFDTKAGDWAVIVSLCVGAFGVVLAVAICALLKETEWRP
jgi:hypothetical protein